MSTQLEPVGAGPTRSSGTRRSSGARRSGGARVLVLSAEVGESHAAMARVLVDELEARADVDAVDWLNDFSCLGPLLARLLPGGFRFHLGEVKWTYDLAYRLFTRAAPARRFGEAALYGLGARALEHAIAAHDADVVVSTYPVMNPVLARLRAAGRIDTPVVAVVGPLAGLRFWVQPSIDLHLAMYPEAIAEIVRFGADQRGTRPVRPLVRSEFYDPPTREQARRALGIPADSRLVLVSGGGWGAGDVAGAVDRALALGDSDVVAVAGRNDALAAALEARYASEPRLSTVRFTDRMRDLLCAADAFVTATAGISCIEARLCGCPTICYGFTIGHVRDNTQAMVGHGLARTAATPEALESELRRALGGERRPRLAAGELPSAAELVAGLAAARPARLLSS